MRTRVYRTCSGACVRLVDTMLQPVRLADDRDERVGRSVDLAPVTIDLRKDGAVAERLWNGLRARSGHHGGHGRAAIDRRHRVEPEQIEQCRPDVHVRDLRVDDDRLR